ncbi:MAG: hypothetical protein AB203_01670 [Parcubacteria bacterium C7867-008]|nr:MAG: hypothetical protein AB203_01670 [Parcubacteria bacterium C7867-008]
MPDQSDGVGPTHFSSLTPPLAQEPSHKNRYLIIIGAVVLILVLVAAAFIFTPLKGYIGALLGQIKIPTELKGATFIADSDQTKTTLYSFDKAIRETEALEGVLVSAEKTAAGEARITRSGGGNFSVSLDEKVLFKDSFPRIGISRSPDGTRVVFAQSLEISSFISPAEGALLPLDRKRWEIIMYEPASRSTINLGKGVSPFFIDQTHVAWIAPAGLAVMDLTTGVTKVLVPDVGGRVIATALVSPDHSVIAWYGKGSKTLLAYKVNTDSAEPLPPTAISGSMRSLALGNDGFFIISIAHGYAELFKQPFGQESASVGRLPGNLGIGRVLLGSI